MHKSYVGYAFAHVGQSSVCDVVVVAAAAAAAAAAAPMSGFFGDGGGGNTQFLGSFSQAHSTVVLQ